MSARTRTTRSISSGVSAIAIRGACSARSKVTTSCPRSSSERIVHTPIAPKAPVTR